MSRREWAKPLTKDDLGDLIEAGAHGLILVVDGVPYSDEDLWACHGCGLRSPDPDFLDPELLCATCGAEADEAAEGLRQEAGVYRAAAL